MGNFQDNRKNQQSSRLTWTEQLNHPERAKRMQALEALFSLYADGVVQKEPVDHEYVNNHIHTTYSFSPYSPSKALWMAFLSGLSTAGIMDHDSIGGAEEFLDAGRILHMGTTAGMECRVDISETQLRGRRINNPDQNGIAYVAAHGIPRGQLNRADAFIKPFREERNRRNQKMTERINHITASFGITLDFDSDIRPLSMTHVGGSITERHLLYALSLKLMKNFGKGQNLVRFLKEALKLNISVKLEALLQDEGNIHYAYDLLGALKSEMVGQFYIPADAECPKVSDFIRFCSDIGAISAYAYLGDVGESVTGDKKAQKFEDEYLELLFTELKRLGFNAVTYMPSRNTTTQLKKVKSLCVAYDLFEISGEDINSSRQKFICSALKEDMFSNLTDAAWALIGHEKEAGQDLEKGMFSKTSVKKWMDLQARVRYYSDIGRKSAAY